MNTLGTYFAHSFSNPYSAIMVVNTFLNIAEHTTNVSTALMQIRLLRSSELGFAFVAIKITGGS